MERRRFFTAWLLLCICAAWYASTAWGFIQVLTPLKDIIAESDFIFVAKFETVDAAKPSAVLIVTEDHKGKSPHRRLPINLTGDREKHTPQLLKRIAPNHPVIVFATEQAKKHIVFCYTNGTWFQIIGTPDGNTVRWSFTHCEIYLRRTFKGTTAELQQVLVDALAGKAKPPAPNPKEPPGFGPEIETQSKNSQSRNEDGGGLLLGVIALPFLMPIAALIQILFPGLLRDHWRQYQIAVYTLLTQSTLIFLQFALRKWVFEEPQKHWWLGDAALTIALVSVAIIGFVVALAKRVRAVDVSPARPPVRVEYFALGIIIVAGLAWGIWQYFDGTNPFRDEMGVMLGGAIVAFVHLWYRRCRFEKSNRAPARLSTELVFLFSLAAIGAGLGWFVHQPAQANLKGARASSDWTMLRGNEERTGAASAADPGPSKPTMLWTFDSAERKGRVRLHSSPTVVEGQVYIGVLHEVLAYAQGYVYCINATDGRMSREQPIKAGARIWRFDAKGSLRGVYSSPSVANGKIYIGEGYHQDQHCRLFCLDSANGDDVVWAKQTQSHVESSPCIVGNRIFFGAGDDGLICISTDQVEMSPDAPPSPKTEWQIGGLHIDLSPLVVNDHVFAGSVVGDIHKELQAIAVHAGTGDVLWRVPAPLPVTGSPSFAEGRVFFGLGNGKVDTDSDQPRGAVWCLNAESGQRQWIYEVPNSVLGTPTLHGVRVYFGCCDGHVYCIRQSDGGFVWKKKIDQRIVSSLVVAADKVYALATSGVLSCLNAGDGAELWRFEELKNSAVNDAYSSPTLANGRLYVAVGGKLYCIGSP